MEWIKAKTFWSMVITWIQYKGLKPLLSLTELINKVGKGDLTVDIDVKSGREIIKLGNAVNKMVSNVRSLILNIKETSDVIVKTTDGLLDASMERFQVSEEIAHTVEEI